MRHYVLYFICEKREKRRKNRIKTQNRTHVGEEANMRRKITALFFVTLALMFTFSCGTDVFTDNSGNASFNGKDGKISFSWWGGDSRHKATLKAVDEFMAANGDVSVSCSYAAWTNWEESFAAQLYAGNAPDLCQININWLNEFGGESCKNFTNLDLYSNYIDLTQYDNAVLSRCMVGSMTKAVPISVTGRIFFWNETTFSNAGLGVPQTLEELYAYAEVLRTKLGDDYYPLALGEYDRFLLMVTYLECRYGKAWTQGVNLGYTEDEIAEGMRFIQGLEERHVIPTLKELHGSGADSIDKDLRWTDGRFAGIFEWDSSVEKYRSALAEGQQLAVGNYFTDMGTSKGGFTKIALAYAIPADSRHPVEAARLLQFLVSNEKAVKAVGTERGIPVNKKAKQVCSDNNLLTSLTALANARVMAWCSFSMDNSFEAPSLKNTDGVYADVMSGLSYGDYSAEEAAKVLASGVRNVLNS